MRQTAVWLLLLAIVVSGCSMGKSTPTPAPTPDPSKPPQTAPPTPAPVKHGVAKADAEALVRAYLNDRAEGRQSAAVERLVPEARNEAAANGQLTQFDLGAATEVEEGWVIQTREYFSVATEPRSILVTDHYLVVKSGDRLAIDRPERRFAAQKAGEYRRVVIEAHPDSKNPQHALVMMQDGKTVLAQMTPNLPKTFRPFGAPADGVFGVGDNGWGALAVSPSGQQIAFVTRGTHAFFGLVDRSGQVKGLNLWFEGGPGELAWSHDSQYLAATNMSPRGVYVLQLWSMQQNAPVEVKGLPDGKDITRLRWQGPTLYLQAGTDRFMVNPASGQAAPAPATGS